MVDLPEFNALQDMNAFGKISAEMRNVIIHSQTHLEFVGKVFKGVERSFQMHS